MSKVSKYLSDTQDEPKKNSVGPSVNGKNQNDYPAVERPCLAHGCPNLGSITSSVGYSHAAAWFCRFHHEKDPADFAKITRRIRLGLNPYLQHNESDDLAA